MKRVIAYLSVSAAAICLLASCVRGEQFDCGDIDGVDAEVEIQVSAAAGGGGSTRSPLDGINGLEVDDGAAHESRITTLDLLAFDHNTGLFLYRRSASEINPGKFRVQMKKVEGTTFDIYLFANCRGVIDRWEASPGDKTLLDWEEVRGVLKFNESEAKALVDPDGIRAETWGGLPMFNEELKDVDVDPAKTPTLWPVNGDKLMLRRAVASVDLFVQQNANTQRFRLKGMFAWYAPDTGYPAAVVDDGAEEYQVNEVSVPLYRVPSDMQARLSAVEGVRNDAGTAWNTAPVLHAYRVCDNLLPPDGYAYEAILYQMYLYENRYLDKTLAAANKRPTRIIMSGEYWTDDDTPPDEANTAGWQDAYYAIDILEDAAGGQNAYRPLIRNWKYELKVVGVTGPGYGTIGEAAVNEPIDLGLDVIHWNKDVQQVGVKGHYYVTMQDRKALLWRYALDIKSLSLSYEIMDGGAADFDIDFKTGEGQQDNGPQDDYVSIGIDNIARNAIRNDYFDVTMSQTHDAVNNRGSVEFVIFTRRDYTEGHDKNTVVVKFRDLEFEFEIEQLPYAEEDWQDGGGIIKDI